MRPWTLAASALCLVPAGSTHAEGPLRRLLRPEPPIVIQVPVVVPPAPAPPVAGSPPPAPEIIAPPAAKPPGPTLPDWITPLDRGPIQTIYVPQGSPAWPAPVAKAPDPVIGKLDGLDKRLAEIDKRLGSMEKLLLIHDDLLRGAEKK